MWQAYGSIIVLILTVILVVWRPKNLNIGWSALIGGILAVILGFVAWENLITILDLVWNATFTLIAIFVISMFLQDIGFFDWAAVWMMKLSKGSGKLYFFYFVVLGALVSAFFSNTGAVLVLTPIILAQMKTLGREACFPLLMVAGIIPNTPSLPLVTSNLTNILSANYFHIGYAEYAANMALSNVTAVLVVYLMLSWLYRKEIPKEFALEGYEEPSTKIKDPFLFKMSWIFLVLLFGCCFADQFFSFPLSLIFWACALIFIILSKVRKRIPPLDFLKKAPWGIIFFSLGMYVVVYGVHNSRGLAWVEEWLHHVTEHGVFASIMGFGIFSTILSAFLNNLPSMIFNALVIDSSGVEGMLKQVLIYANLIGCDVGAKISPIGTLATLLWFYLLKKENVPMSWGYYCKIVLFLAPITLFFVLIVFWLQVTWWGIL